MKTRVASKQAAPARRAAVLVTVRPSRKRSSRTRPKYPDIRRDLERQRAAILQEAGITLTARPGLEAFPDVSDQASAEVDQNFSMRIRERERKLLKKIDEAL